MSKTIRFAFFLVSKFKGQTLEGIGIGIFGFIFIQGILFRSSNQTEFIIETSLIFISAVLIFLGEWLRKKSGIKQPPS